MRITKNDISRGKKILESEKINLISPLSVFDAIIYTILSQRELYKTQVKHYYIIREEGMMHPHHMLRSPSILWRCIRGMSLAPDKLNRILQTSEYYYDNEKFRPFYMLKSAHNQSRNTQVMKRELFIKGCYGVSNKSASMIMMKMGCTKMAILDTWVLQWLEYEYISTNSNMEYRRLEEIIGNYARGNHCTMANFSAAIWGKLSSFNESVDINKTHTQEKLSRWY